MSPDPRFVSLAAIAILSSHSAVAAVDPAVVSAWNQATAAMQRQADATAAFEKATLVEPVEGCASGLRHAIRDMPSDMADVSAELDSERNTPPATNRFNIDLININTEAIASRVVAESDYIMRSISLCPTDAYRRRATDVLAALGREGEAARQVRRALGR